MAVPQQKRRNKKYNERLLISDENDEMVVSKMRNATVGMHGLYRRRSR